LPYSSRCAASYVCGKTAHALAALQAAVAPDAALPAVPNAAKHAERNTKSEHSLYGTKAGLLKDCSELACPFLFCITNVFELLHLNHLPRRKPLLSAGTEEVSFVVIPVIV
jgi:hypothetical protein